jgi:hypothetical protein
MLYLLTSRLGSDHRIERHYYNEDVKNTIKRHWDGKRVGLGEKAVVEWLFHIAIDNLATAFKMSSKSFSYGSKTYNLMEFGFGRSGYMKSCRRSSTRKDYVFRFVWQKGLCWGVLSEVCCRVV